MVDSFVPSDEVIEKYSEVLVNYALNSGQGVKPGEVVECLVPDVAKPLAHALQNTLLKAGAIPMVRLLPTGLDKDFFLLANAEQLTFFPKKYLKARAQLIDHTISIIAQVDPLELSAVDPRKIIMARDAKKEFRDWLVEKENRDAYTWTIGLWGVEAKAKIVGLSLEEYWQQIIHACMLDKPDPVAEWKQLSAMKQDIRTKLNDMKIREVHVTGEDIDLRVRIGEDRIWKGGGGRNIPSFEIFTSPDWRGTNGWVRFNEPLYRYGHIVKDIYLEFKQGKVVKAEASQGNELLQHMLEAKNANKAGEFSLTDSRMSRITHPMAETLYDENIGGPYGNTHIAIGMAYKDCYRGDASKVSKQQWRTMGFNDSAEHTDMVSTTNRLVTAFHGDGQETVIYQDGQFVV